MTKTKQKKAKKQLHNSHKKPAAAHKPKNSTEIIKHKNEHVTNLTSNKSHVNAKNTTQKHTKPQNPIISDKIKDIGIKPALAKDDKPIKVESTKIITDDKDLNKQNILDQKNVDQEAINSIENESSDTAIAQHNNDSQQDENNDLTKQLEDLLNQAVLVEKEIENKPIELEINKEDKSNEVETDLKNTELWTKPLDFDDLQPRQGNKTVIFEPTPVNKTPNTKKTYEENKVKKNTKAAVLKSSNNKDDIKSTDAKKSNQLKNPKNNKKVSATTKNNAKTNNSIEKNENKPSVLTNLPPNMKFSAIFLTIITLGVFWFYLLNKVEEHKEINDNENQDSKILKISNKIPFDITKLINALGTKTNIKAVDASLNSLKIEFIERTKIDDKAIRALGAKGLMFSNNKLSVIFGDYALTLKEELLKVLDLKPVELIKNK